MSWSRSVFSSVASEIAYDSETQELTVVWNAGRTSVYSGVPEGLAESLSRAASVGQMLNSDIKPFYSHKYLT